MLDTGSWLHEHMACRGQHAVGHVCRHSLKECGYAYPLLFRRQFFNDISSQHYVGDEVTNNLKDVREPDDYPPSIAK